MQFRKPMILVDFPTRRFWSVCLALVAALLAAVSLSAQRAERATLDITGYVIDAELDTATHHIAAKAQVTFTAPESADEVSFGFHPALKINKITDDAGKLLTGERLADGTIGVAPSKPFAAGQPTTGPSTTKALSPAMKTARSKASSSLRFRSRSHICSTPHAGSPPPAS